MQITTKNPETCKGFREKVSFLTGICNILRRELVSEHDYPVFPCQREVAGADDVHADAKVCVGMHVRILRQFLEIKGVRAYVQPGYIHVLPQGTVNASELDLCKRHQPQLPCRAYKYP